MIENQEGLSYPSKKPKSKDELSVMKNKAFRKLKFVVSVDYEALGFEEVIKRCKTFLKTTVISFLCLKKYDIHKMKSNNYNF